MQPSSRKLLVLVGVLVVATAVWIYTIYQFNKPDYTEQDADTMLAALTKAFRNENANEVVSFAWPDADVAGRELQSIHDGLARGFAAVKDLKVVITRFGFHKTETKVVIDAHATASDASGAGLYNAPVTLTLERRPQSHFGGLLTTYAWKITKVDATALPTGL